MEATTECHAEEERTSRPRSDSVSIAKRLFASACSGWRNCRPGEPGALTADMKHSFIVAQCYRGRYDGMKPQRKLPVHLLKIILGFAEQRVPGRLRRVADVEVARHKVLLQALNRGHARVHRELARPRRLQVAHHTQRRWQALMDAVGEDSRWPSSVSFVTCTRALALV